MTKTDLNKMSKEQLMVRALDLCIAVEENSTKKELIEWILAVNNAPVAVASESDERAPESVESVEAGEASSEQAPEQGEASESAEAPSAPVALQLIDFDRQVLVTIREFNADGQHDDGIEVGQIAVATDSKKEEVLEAIAVLSGLGLAHELGGFVELTAKGLTCDLDAIEVVEPSDDTPAPAPAPEAPKAPVSATVEGTKLTDSEQARYEFFTTLLDAVKTQLPGYTRASRIGTKNYMVFPTGLTDLELVVTLTKKTLSLDLYISGERAEIDATYAVLEGAKESIEAAAGEALAWKNDGKSKNAKITAVTGVGSTEELIGWVLPKLKGLKESAVAAMKKPATVSA